MLTFEKFTGINNVLPSERMGESELMQATNVDIGLTGEIRRRSGYSAIVDTCHKNLHQGRGFLLATRDGGELAAVDGITGAVVASLHPALGVARVSYCDLPDGRTAFSNGALCGITDGLTATEWGVPTPDSVGALTPVTGQLDSGDYQYRITYVRLSDGLEGAPAFAPPTAVPDGGVLLTGLPQRAGFKINVYLTGSNGDAAMLAGATFGSSFSYLGKNDALMLPCRTEFLSPAPAGQALAFYRGRVLVAQGNVLWASLPNQWEHFDLRRDFKQFSAPITFVQPVDDGVYVGTEHEVAFLGGGEFDKLVYQQALGLGAVRGSSVAVRGELVSLGKNNGSGSAMLCIAGRDIMAGFNGGVLVSLTQGRYAVGAGVTEVAATFRVVDGVPQYLAVVQ